METSASGFFYALWYCKSGLHLVLLIKTQGYVNAI